MLITAHSPNSEHLFTYISRLICLEQILHFPGGVRSDRHNGMTALGKIQRFIKFNVEEYLHVNVEHVFADVDELLMEVSN